MSSRSLNTVFNPARLTFGKARVGLGSSEHWLEAAGPVGQADGRGTRALTALECNRHGNSHRYHKVIKMIRARRFYWVLEIVVREQVRYNFTLVAGTEYPKIGAHKIYVHGKKSLPIWPLCKLPTPVSRYSLTTTSINAHYCPNDSIKEDKIPHFFLEFVEGGLWSSPSYYEKITFIKITEARMIHAPKISDPSIMLRPNLNLRLLLTSLPNR